MESSTSQQPFVVHLVDYAEEAVHVDATAVVLSNSDAASNSASAVPVDVPSELSDGVALKTSATGAAEGQSSAVTTMVPALTRGQRQARGEPEPLQRLEHTGRTPVAGRAVPRNSASVDVPRASDDECQEGEIDDMADEDRAGRDVAVVLATHEGREFPVFSVTA